MANHIADIPRPMYGFVKDEYLYDLVDGHGDYSEAMLYGLSALPGRAWGISALLKNGSVIQHLPVSSIKHDTLPCDHKLQDLQVWSCYGWDFAAHEYSALKEMPVRVYMKNQNKYINGRYWFTAAPYGDQYSSTPDQHKHFNFVWLECGCLAAMPGNRVQFYDSSFVEIPEERPGYLVNTRYWFPEGFDAGDPFDKIISSRTG